MRSIRNIAICLAILCIPAYALAGPPNTLLRDLRAARAEAVASPGALVKLSELQSFAGDTAGAIATIDRVNSIRPRQAPSPEALRLLDDAMAEDAIKAIIAAARDKRAVLINEAHTVPMTRAFTRKLMAELKKIGYTYLACEGFNDTPLAQMSYLTRYHGYYTNEPMFAGLVNEALADGYTLVGYDSNPRDSRFSGLAPKGRAGLRELIQAQNIVDRIYARDKNAKVLIHVGHHHLVKIGDDQTAPMGAHLRRLLGENASLHIDQTQFFAHSGPASESSMYRPVLAKFPSASPFILRKKDGSNLIVSGMDGMIDMEVIFPAYGERDGRPEWLQSLAERAPRAIPPELLPASGERLILAYAKEHGDDATPTDAVLVEAGKPVPKLMLPKGEFRYTVQD